MQGRGWEVVQCQQTGKGDGTGGYEGDKTTVVLCVVWSGLPVVTVVSTMAVVVEHWSYNGAESVGHCGSTVYMMH